MELEEEQLVLNASALLIKQYVPKFGWEVLPNGNEDQLIYLNKEDIGKIAINIYHLGDHITGIYKALRDGATLLLTDGKVSLVKPSPQKFKELSRFQLNLESIGITN